MSLDDFPTLTSLSLLWLDFGLDVDQQRVQRKTVRQDEVADVVATDTERLQLSGLSVFEGHLHSFEVSVHADIHTWTYRHRSIQELLLNLKQILWIIITCDRPVDLCAILQLNSDCFMAQFHQKPAGSQSKTTHHYKQRYSSTNITDKESWQAHYTRHRLDSGWN